MKHARRIRRVRAGVTLVELMIALSIGLILSSTTYYVAAGSSRTFNEQQRLAQLQTSVRSAMRQMQRDISMAGFLGTPNSTKERDCPSVASENVQAIEFDDDRSTENIPNAAANGSRGDLLALTGAYSSQEQFLVRTLSTAGNELFLQETWQGYRRVFEGLSAEDKETVFDDVFQPGRVLHLETHDYHFFVRIVSTVPSQSSITFSPALPIGPCTGGFSTGATVSVLTRYQYGIADASIVGGGATNLEPVDATITGPNSYLIRREIDFDGDAVETSAPKVFLEWAVDFDLDFHVDTETSPSGTPIVQRFLGEEVDDNLTSIGSNPAAWPERVRSVVVSLAARTAEHDPRFEFPIGTRPLRAFSAFDRTERPGGSRVRSLRAEIFVPNVAARVLR